MADLKSPSRFSIRGIYNSLTSEPKAAPTTPAPAPSPAPSPKQEASQPSAISSYAGMIAQQRREKEAGLKDGGQMKDGTSGTVPGKGKGDKIKAKYEPGEFVVSNAMLSANPGLEQYLSQLRTKALAAQGKSPEDTVAGSFKGGVIHALNGLDPSDSEKRLSQIPNSAPAGWTGGTGERVSGNELTRNMLPAAMALGPMAPVAAGVARAASAVPGLIASPIAQTALAYGVPAAGAAGLWMASSSPSTPPVNPMTRSVATPTIATKPPVVAPTITPASAPVQSAPVQAGTPTSVDGVTRIDQPGQSPMFTNLSASDPSNQSLAARGVPSAQNINAAQSLSDRYSAEASNAAKVDQYNQEVAAAQAFNAQPTAKDTGGYGILSKEYQARRNASFAPAGVVGRKARDAAILQQNKGLDDNALQGIRNEGETSRASILESAGLRRTAMQEAGANNRAVMTNQVASQRAGAEISKLAAETQAMNQLQALREQLVNEKDPAKQATLSEKMQVIMGKYQRPEPAARDVYGAIAGGVDALGNKTDPIIYNKQTGERAGAQAGPAYPEGTKLTGPDKKPYIVKNGIPVPA